MSSIWRSLRLRSDVKIRLFGAAVVPGLLYGCESWDLTEKIERRIKDNCASMLASITRRGYAEECRDPSVDIASAAHRQRTKWLGHIIRMEETSPVRTTIMEKELGGRLARSCVRYLNNINDKNPITSWGELCARARRREI